MDTTISLHDARVFKRLSRRLKKQSLLRIHGTSFRIRYSESLSVSEHSFLGQKAAASPSRLQAGLSDCTASTPSTSMRQNSDGELASQEAARHACDCDWIFRHASCGCHEPSKTSVSEACSHRYWPCCHYPCADASTKLKSLKQVCRQRSDRAVLKYQRCRYFHATYLAAGSSAPPIQASSVRYSAAEHPCRPHLAPKHQRGHLQFQRSAACVSLSCIVARRWTNALRGRDLVAVSSLALEAIRRIAGDALTSSSRRNCHGFRRSGSSRLNHAWSIESRCENLPQKLHSIFVREAAEACSVKSIPQPFNLAHGPHCTLVAPPLRGGVDEP